MYASGLGATAIAYQRPLPTTGYQLPTRTIAPVPVKLAVPAYVPPVRPSLNVTAGQALFPVLLRPPSSPTFPQMTSCGTRTNPSYVPVGQPCPADPRGLVAPLPFAPLSFAPTPPPPPTSGSGPVASLTPAPVPASVSGPGMIFGVPAPVAIGGALLALWLLAGPRRR